MGDAEVTPPNPAGRPGWGTSLLLLVSLGLVLAGIFMPALRVNSYWFWTQEHSIWSGTMTFFEQGRTALGAGLFAVSIAFPVIKIVLALMTVAAFTPGHVLTNGLLGLLAILSRWSMTDVFVLAVAVLVLDGRLVTTADLREGAWYFASGVLLSTAIVYSMLMRAKRAVREAAPEPPLEDRPA
ncbi:MAG: paraquat-inducible protein A [Alphaproteobacteria bacterium]